jgi:hypothetical protein
MSNSDIFYDTATNAAVVQYTSGLWLDCVLESHPNDPDKFIFIIALPQELDNHYDDNVTVVGETNKLLNSRKWTLLLPGDFVDDGSDETQIKMVSGVWSCGKFLKVKANSVVRADRVVRGSSVNRSMSTPPEGFAAVREKLCRAGFAPASHVVYRTRATPKYPSTVAFVEGVLAFDGPQGFDEWAAEVDWSSLTVPCVLHGDWYDDVFRVHVVELVCARAHPGSPRRVLVDRDSVSKFVAGCQNHLVTAAEWATKTEKVCHPTADNAVEPPCRAGMTMVPVAYRYKLLGATVPVRWMHEYDDLVWVIAPQPRE